MSNALPTLSARVLALALAAAWSAPAAAQLSASGQVAPRATPAGVTAAGPTSATPAANPMGTTPVSAAGPSASTSNTPTADRVNPLTGKMTAIEQLDRELTLAKLQTAIAEERRRQRDIEEGPKRAAEAAAAAAAAAKRAEAASSSVRAPAIPAATRAASASPSMAIAPPALVGGAMTPSASGASPGWGPSTAPIAFNAGPRLVAVMRDGELASALVTQGAETVTVRAGDTAFGRKVVRIGERSVELEGGSKLVLGDALVAPSERPVRSAGTAGTAGGNAALANAAMNAAMSPGGNTPVNTLAPGVNPLAMGVPGLQAVGSNTTPPAVGGVGNGGMPAPLQPMSPAVRP